MLFSLLPKEVINALKNTNIKYLCEIRMRVNMPIIINILGESCFLSHFGQTTNIKDAIICTKLHIDYVIDKASNSALYSINDQLVNGYISCKGGIRIGVAGEFVYVNDTIKTIKNFQSLNIRIPHEVNNCSYNYLQSLISGNTVYNTLILSPAGAGKTTFIRDLSKQLLVKFGLKNILIVDERCEITGISNGQAYFDGFNCDILSNCKKSYAFDNGIRSLRPDIIVTDEISNRDIQSIVNALTCGVKVIATIHAQNILDLKNKRDFLEVLQNKMFDRFVVLSDIGKIGEVVGIYNADLECIGI